MQLAYHITSVLGLLCIILVDANTPEKLVAGTYGNSRYSYPRYPNSWTSYLSAPQLSGNNVNMGGLLQGMMTQNTQGTRIVQQAPTMQGLYARTQVASPRFSLLNGLFGNGGVGTGSFGTRSLGIGSLGSGVLGSGILGGGILGSLGNGILRTGTNVVQVPNVVSTGNVNMGSFVGQNGGFNNLLSSFLSRMPEILNQYMTTKPTVTTTATTTTTTTTTTAPTTTDTSTVTETTTTTTAPVTVTATTVFYEYWETVFPITV